MAYNDFCFPTCYSLETKPNLFIVGTIHFMEIGMHILGVSSCFYVFIINSNLESNSHRSVSNSIIV